MLLEVYEDEDVRFHGRGPKQAIERWAWLEEECSSVITGPWSERLASTTTRIAPLLTSHPHIATTPTAPLKDWARRVHAYSESEAMFRLQEDALEYRNSKALSALNAARVMVHNVFGFTGRRADQAKTSMYLYQMTLVHVSLSLRGGCAKQTAPKSKSDTPGMTIITTTQRVMEDDAFHKALITVCLEVCAFVYRDDDGRFGDGFPVLTNVVEQGGRLPELLACLDWFSQAFGGRGDLPSRYSLAMPPCLADYVDLIADVVVDRGLFGESGDFEGSHAVAVGSLLISPEHPPVLISYCLRSTLLYLHTKIEFIIRRAWRSACGDDIDEHTAEAWGADESRAAVSNATQRMVGFLLRERLDVLFGSTCSLIAVCCAFCTGKVLGCDRTRFARLCSAAGLSSGVAREFYNTIFLPVVYGFERERLFGAACGPLSTPSA